MTGAVDHLLRLGFLLIPEPEGTILVRYPVGGEPPNAQALLGELRNFKAKALTYLNGWDEALARLLVQAAFDRTDRAWSSDGSTHASRHDPEVVAALKEIMDDMDTSLREKNMSALVHTMVRFDDEIRRNPRNERP